jgi:DAK2 domain fusion protein YloV
LLDTLDTLDGAAVRRWAQLAADALDRHRAEIDALNVYPVADSDTGTNIALTFRAGADAAGLEVTLEVAAVLSVLARAAVLGARGNSGVIVSQLLRGLAEGLEGAPNCDGPTLCTALEQAADLAYASVSEPQEGTILTVARAAALAARATAGTAASASTDPVLLHVVIRAAVEGAAQALQQTPEQLPILARAGVVDAGGRGLLVLLDALCMVITGGPSSLDLLPPRPRSAGVLEVERESGSPAFGYEVQFLLDAPEAAIAELRMDLAGLGDSVAVVGTGTDVWNVHVHVNDVGAAMEAGVRAGRPHRITVVRFADQLADRRPTPVERPSSELPTGPTVVLVLLDGSGLEHLFDGAVIVVIEDVIEDGPAAAMAGEAAVLAGLRAVGASRAVLLPNGEQLTAIAARAARIARAEGIDVSVVPTRSPLQGLAAIAVHDGQRRAEDDAIAMAEAAAATRFAEVNVALEAALTTIGPCQAGDILGLIDGDVIEIGSAVGPVADAVLDRLLGIGGELVTVVLGPGAPAGAEASIRARIHQLAPLTEIVVYAGHLAGAPLLIGME